MPSVSTKLRYYEYYDMQDTFDWLYQRSLDNRMNGIDLCEIITSERNILLAFRMIKSNSGSTTSGVDNQKIQDYKILDKNEFIASIRNALEDYQPQSVRRVEIPKANGSLRPLGIPTMRDRLIQQMFKQVLEPICEAKFYAHSYGFRPNRSTHHAIAKCTHLINTAGHHYVVDVDIQGFFDNVNHTKLLNQLYTIGVKDKRVLAIIGKMLKAPVDKLGIQHKGCPQGAILSPLLSNVVLNDLDQWISRQWETFPSNKNYATKSGKYRQLRLTTHLKEMYIVRYADDFKVFTNNHKQAWKIFHAVKGYLKNHLKLDSSPEKSKVTNLRKRRSEFLGFEIRAVQKRNKYVAQIHISKKNQKSIRQKVKEQIKKIQESPTFKNTRKYNSYVLGIHNYYGTATQVNIDFSKIAFSLSSMTYNRLIRIASYEVPRSPPNAYKKFYSTNRRTYRISETYLYPLDDIKWKFTPNFSQNINNYTPKGRIEKVKKLKPSVLVELSKMQKVSTCEQTSLEYSDNRLSRYSMQNGKCAITGIFLTSEDVHCHHIVPKSLGGTDTFSNLVIIHKWLHRLIHASSDQTIERYKRLLKLTGKQFEKVNKYRGKCNLTSIY